MKWKVPLFDVDFDESELKAVQDVISSGWLTMGEITWRLERQFADFVGVKNAFAVSSCTAALHIANMALGIGSGHEVVCPSLNFVAGANSIVYTGAKPVFAEIKDLNELNIAAEDVEKKITRNTKAVQVMHYGGYPCDMDKIMELSDKYDLSVIEDCAHALGAEYKNRKCGTIGDIGCFSFFSNKNMTTAEGGMITTNNDNLSERIKLMRSHGMTSLTLDRHYGHAFSYDVVRLGFNYRIDEIRSAIGMVQLKKLPKNNDRRRDLTLLYRERLTGMEGIIVPFEHYNGISSYHIFPIILDTKSDRTGFMEFLKARGIQSSIHYPPIHLFKYYRRTFGTGEGQLSLTEDASKRLVTLPLYPTMGDERVHNVCDVISEYLKERKIRK